MPKVRHALGQTLQAAMVCLCPKVSALATETDGEVSKLQLRCIVHDAVAHRNPCNSRHCPSICTQWNEAPASSRLIIACAFPSDHLHLPHKNYTRPMVLNVWEHGKHLPVAIRLGVAREAVAWWRQPQDINWCQRNKNHVFDPCMRNVFVVQCFLQ